jgi:transcriptional regulator with XRE-family HTH domain
MSQGKYEAVVAANLRGVRASRQMSAQAVATVLAWAGSSLTRRALSMIENGRRGVSVDELVEIATAFGLRPESMLSPQCETCWGAPPDGFTCRTCGAVR